MEGLNPSKSAGLDNIAGKFLKEVTDLCILSILLSSFPDECKVATLKPLYKKILNIRYGDTEIKQHTKLTYLGCILDNDLSGESMVTKVLDLINGRLKF